VTRTVESAVEEIVQGKRLSVYLLFGDELLTRQGAQKIADALVPAAERLFGVEVLSEDSAPASVPLRLRTVPLLGGLKVVVVHDTKAFVSKQGVGQVFRRSFEVWKEDDLARAMRLWLQGVGTAGQDRTFLERAAQGGLDEAAWRDLLGMAPEPEAEAWVQAVASQALADGAAIPSGGGGTARMYEDLLKSLPAGAVLVLTAEVVDQRRALFKRIAEIGAVLDCSVRAGKAGETQMRPELARAKIREAIAAAQKQIDADAVEWIIERTGFSMRGLASELEKLVLFVGERRRIQVADAAAVLTSTRETGLFDLTRALDERDAGRALRAVRGLLAQREAEIAILGLVAAEIRQLLVARCAIDIRLGGALDPAVAYPGFQSRILPRLAGAGPDDGSAAKLSAMHPFRAYNLVRAAARYSQDELLRALRAMHALDLAGKTAGALDAVALETLLLDLCRAAQP
jgi:DNA polymerase III subunit delta